MSETEASKNWFARRAEVEAKKDTITFSERVGNIVGVVIGLLFVWYFVAHQTGSTGFFTSRFGTLEALLFYGSIVFGIVSAVLRGLSGRKNVARLFDIFEAIFAAVAIAWLFIVFPFDFTHLADLFPDFLKFLLLWISNDVAKVLMVLAMIVTLVMSIYTATFYVLVRKELSKPATKTA
ncbi:MAG: hypothetical protein JSV85_03445 [Candidatus Bathyarchaeota archaeon]|nr:MAG: hypothetical protein JSV85_03445 [Candidatus Bathyarchaeota archaeon]